ncbi:hypothetical protein ANCDUO_17085 [Ancylostoma duodenale]|uniref:Uncharacterized protein n=1 Tax=Ancylostoma duodenale TaxID=51022 RepID=A0A0C2FW48_9BILA|nr:hypothetical protein ANCDUO_17085 [Ancylostoma duodenale]
MAVAVTVMVEVTLPMDMAATFTPKDPPAISTHQHKPPSYHPPPSYHQPPQTSYAQPPPSVARFEPPVSYAKAPSYHYDRVAPAPAPAAPVRPTYSVPRVEPPPIGNSIVEAPSSGYVLPPGTYGRARSKA